MRTVKEISDLTGISVRTLHYYDEIGLLKPTDKSEAGYRLYDDKALETLQQILFFREFDISLKEIKAVIENPALEKNQILQMQRKMLVAKKERMERLITSIDRILKGDNTMDFEVFTKIELEDMYNSMAANMSEEQKAIFIENYGSMEEWKKKFLEDASTEAVQKNFQKIVEWYGSKEKALDASKNPGNTEIFPAYQKQLEEIVKKLAGKKGQDVNSFEVKELVEEYDFVTKQMFQLPDATSMELEIAAIYRTNKEIQAVQDSIYGEGTTEFIGQVIEAFYSKK
ncbi:MerR family transcriptional regulator [Blautia sp. ICN-22010]|uniref:MerR family transcriptional regulator n=1 Tax=unclassified Blautia TaxID=2648079 RepID=UPI0030C38F5A